jgi:[FeFe] hydrogenase H-cluster maturation GTPase HydF
MASRIHIGFFGRRNVGKSSVINALAEQPVAIVSDTPGTTTDPVRKSMELLGIGPAVLIDTAGIDDSGDLGTLRVEKSKQVIAQIDLAVLVIAGNTFGAFEEALIAAFNDYAVPFLVLHNKADVQKITPALLHTIEDTCQVTAIDYSARQPEAAHRLLLHIQALLPALHKPASLLEGLVAPHDVVLLITPIDSEAPEGRLILPQVQTIRAALDNDCVVVTLKETAVEAFLRSTRIRPKLAITDSQLFGRIDRMLPPDIPLTGFSILLARYKGDFDNYLKGTPTIDRLQHGNHVLILESCTHQSTCDDIGRVKIPQWLQEYTGKTLRFTVVSGLSPLPHNISEYALVIQCGGCMITARQLKNRLKPFVTAGIPVTNYGMAIAYLKGIYPRATALFI